VVLTLAIGGIGADNALAAESFKNLMNISSDPQLKVRATAQWKRFVAKADKQGTMAR